jgi:hypothetical protein
MTAVNRNFAPVQAQIDENGSKSGLFGAVLRQHHAFAPCRLNKWLIELVYNDAGTAG